MKKKKPKKQFQTRWAFEPFEEDETFFEKRMFGALAAYLQGKLVMVLAENPGQRDYRGKDYAFDIWDGILLPTERAHHESLTQEFSDLKSHPVLGKWLYLPASTKEFEFKGNEMASKIAEGDERFGVYPKLK